MSKEEMLHYLEANAQDFYNLSDCIWENAEVRFKEYRSSKEIMDFLQSAGFQVTTGIAGLKTGFLAKWGQGKPVIGFLGEYDALPGLSQKAGIANKEQNPSGTTGHGCGHNLLGVGSLIGAIGLKKYLEEGNNTGTIIYFGCPAEEGGSGKTFMAREGCFDDLDCAFSWHPEPVTIMPPGSLLANCMKRYSFTGKSAHAATSPEQGRSALDALELMNIGIQFLREHVPSTARIHYAITETGGNAPNVVQAYAQGLYQVRAPKTKDVVDITKRIDDIARGAALMTGTEVSSEYLKGTSNTILIPALDQIMDSNLREISNTILDASDLDFAWDLVKTQRSTDQMPINPIDTSVKPYNYMPDISLPGSSDTGDVSWVCPLSQCAVATWPVGTVAHTWQVVASGKSDFAHRGMLYAGMVLAATALDVVEHPEILKEAKKQFMQNTKGEPYTCPIPENVTPEWLEKRIG